MERNVGQREAPDTAQDVGGLHVRRSVRYFARRQSEDVTDFELELALWDHVVLFAAHEDHELFFLEV